MTTKELHDWIRAAAEAQRTIFGLSQKPGVPESARKNCDAAREQLHFAQVNTQFEVYSVTPQDIEETRPPTATEGQTQQ